MYLYRFEVILLQLVALFQPDVADPTWLVELIHLLVCPCALETYFL